MVRRRFLILTLTLTPQGPIPVEAPSDVRILPQAGVIPDPVALFVQVAVALTPSPRAKSATSRLRGMLLGTLRK